LRAAGARSSSTTPARTSPTWRPRETTCIKQGDRSTEPNKGGHRERAIELVDQAINEVNAGIEFARSH